MLEHQIYTQMNMDRKDQETEKLQRAAEQLRLDYLNNSELTVFTTLGAEDFMEEIGLEEE